MRRQEQELHRQIGDNQPRMDPPEKLPREISQKDSSNSDQEIARLKKPRQSITEVILNPDLDISRESSTGIGGLNNPTILANTRQLQLIFESKEKYESYRAVLTFDRESDQIWSKKILKARPYHNGKAIILNIPPNIFTEGDYRLTLKGIIAGMEEEEIDSYSFTVVKK